ncbi:CLCN3 [Cordylochernes scorpioides]|uniref:CLCN3 n=1 Tax=Cordylochernes scorpioides TaxID=51811 RepID=A0ABY6JUM2_9ARAC|nr:CLCN3 [Cordylochernes scorpioides]
MLEMVEENPNWKEKVITGDETWVYGYDPETKRQSMEWKGKEEPRTMKSRLCKSKNKVLLVTFFDIKGIVHYEYLEEGQTINKESYLNIMRRVRESIRLKRSEINAKINSEYYQNNILEPIFLNDIPSIYGKQSNKVWFHHDNATSHTSSSTQAYLEDQRQRTGINTIPKNRTPVKSPDLAPMDFCIFGCLKRALGKRHPRTIEGLWKSGKGRMGSFEYDHDQKVSAIVENQVPFCK